jgi:hypothetical protein
MNRLTIPKVVLAALFPLVLSCGDDNGTSGDATSFSATLTGANEVPAVTTPATGTATFTVSGGQITYTINATNLQNAILGHIHLAAVGVNGPVRLNLCGTGDPQPACTSQPSGTGVVATGTNVNVHTTTPGCTQGQPGCNPGGEIRGQIVAN